MLRQWSKVLSAGFIATGIVVTACGDDESRPDDGSGGKAGSSGASSGGMGTPSGGSSTAGAMNRGGSSGRASAGEGNMTSEGGAPNGGAGDTAGTSGKTGSSGTVGTTGGTEGEGGDGAGGDGGFGGSFYEGGSGSTGEGGYGGEIAETGDAGSGGSGEPPPPIDVELGAVFSPSVNLPLAPGGVNFATVELTGDPTIPLTVTLTAAGSPGVSVPTPSQQVSLAAGETKTVTVRIEGADVSTGGGQVTLTATPTPGLATDAVSKTFYIDFYDDLARNNKPTTSPPVADDPALAPFPHAYASSFQANPAPSLPQPPWMAFDSTGEGKSDANTFWVSDGSDPGDGPTPENPEWLAVDFGAPVQIGSVAVVQRYNANGNRVWRPRTYKIQTSANGEDWTDIKEEVDVPNENAPTVSTISPKANARYLRLYITAAYDPGGYNGECMQGGVDVCANPRNVQVAGLEVRP